MKARRARGEKPVARIVSFARGLQTLPNALAAALPPATIRTRTAVVSLTPGRPWKLVSRHDGLAGTDEFDAIVLAVPAATLAQLPIGSSGARPLAPLEQVEYLRWPRCFFGFRRDQVAHPLDGFGALVPEVEGRSVLGFCSLPRSFRNGRRRHVALTVYVGGTANPTSPGWRQRSCAPRAGDLRELLGVRGDPVFSHATFWPHAIPQYNLGYERFLDAITLAETNMAGFSSVATSAMASPWSTVSPPAGGWPRSQANTSPAGLGPERR